MEAERSVIHPDTECVRSILLQFSRVFSLSFYTSRTGQSKDLQLTPLGYPFESINQYKVHIRGLESVSHGIAISFKQTSLSVTKSVKDMRPNSLRCVEKMDCKVSHGGDTKEQNWTFIICPVTMKTPVCPSYTDVVQQKGLPDVLPYCDVQIVRLLLHSTSKFENVCLIYIPETAWKSKCL